MAHEATEKDVIDCVEGAFDAMPHLRAFRFETAHGTALRININSTIGRVQLLYLLPPVARALLNRYEEDTTGVKALTVLTLICVTLPATMQNGAENALDITEVFAQKLVVSLASIAARDPELYDPAIISELQQDALARMNARNVELIGRSRVGKKARVNLERIIAAVGMLRRENKSNAEITPPGIADRIGAGQSRVYQVLHEEGIDLEELLTFYNQDAK
jgi:hypothetical protein